MGKDLPVTKAVLPGGVVFYIYVPPLPPTLEEKSAGKMPADFCDRRVFTGEKPFREGAFPSRASQFFYPQVYVFAVQRERL